MHIYSVRTKLSLQGMELHGIFNHTYSESGQGENMIPVVWSTFWVHISEQF